MEFTIKRINVENKAGKYQIPAILTIPASQGKVSCVVMCHGTGTNKDEAGNGYIMFSEKLARNGIASIRFDFAGSGESKEPYINYNFTSAVSDVKAIYECVSKEVLIDSSRIGIMGWSQGGTIAMLAAGKFSMFQSVLCWAGAPDMKGLVPEEGYKEGKEKGFYMLNLGFGDPLQIGWKWMEEAINTDVLAEFSKCTAPVLAIAGTKDVIVPSENAKKILQVSSNEKSEEFYIEGADHCFHIFEDPDRYFPKLMDKSLTWFQKTLS